MQKKASNLNIRQDNRNLIYKYILHHGELSRSEVAMAVRLSSPTVLTLTNELLSEGYLEEVGEMESTGGRRPVALKAVENYRYALGIRLSEYSYTLALTNMSEKLLAHQSYWKKISLTEQCLSDINRAALNFLEEQGVAPKLLEGAGISLNYIINGDQEIIEVPDENGKRTVKFSELARNFSFPCYFINDAKASAFSEAIPVGSRGRFFYLALNASVGGAIVNSQREWHMDSERIQNLFPYCINHGEHWRSGNVGHVILHPNGKQCSCGKSGCVNAYCSADVLAQYTNGNLREFTERLHQGERECAAAWDEYLDNLALTIINIRAMMDCDIVIGGSVAALAEEYQQQLVEKIQKFSNDEAPVDYIRPSSNQVAFAAFGAALCIIDHLINHV